MGLLLGFAFLAGIVTILSPCVLPVLPVIFSGALGPGRLRPWGILVGFILSFTVLTLTLSTLVQAWGLDPDLVRWTSAGLFLVFGAVLVVPSLKSRFASWATTLVTRTSRPQVSRKARGGFWSGLVLGAGLGAVWTPCVGPIMASVITLSLSQSAGFSSLLITLAYTLGTALPLLAVMKGGRSLLNRVPWLTRHTDSIQRGFGVLMMVTALALATGADRAFSTWVLTTFPCYGSGLTALEGQKAVLEELKKHQPAPQPGPQAEAPDPLTRGQGAWLNSPPLTLEGLRGKVVLVDFWTYSCINCLRTLPYLRDWDARYRDQGLVIVGVHSPEFAFEQSEDNLRRAVAEFQVNWPVVQDNAFGIWNAYQNQYWPAHYLYDRQGNLIETHAGEGGYLETEAAIVRALGIAPREGLTEPYREKDAAGPQTPETYLGYGRGARFASPEEVVPDQEAVYSVPRLLEADHWALGGTWTIGQEASSGGPGSSLTLNFQGNRVYLVMGPGPGGPVWVRVDLDGQPRPAVRVDAEKLYQMAEGPQGNKGTLRLEFEGPVRVYAFTFGFQ